MEAFVAKHGKLGEGFSKLDIVNSLEHPGRRTTAKGYQSPTAWISDRVALNQTIILCSYCRKDFNPRKVGYRKFYAADNSGVTDGYTVNGKCDRCKQFTVNCGGGVAFIPEATYPTVCIDPAEARRKARAAAGQRSVWRHIQKERD